MNVHRPFACAATVVGATVLAALAPRPAGAQVVYQTDFESYQPGSVAGQDGWLPDNDRQADPQIVRDPTGGSHGQVLCIDPVGTAGWSGAFHPLGTDLAAAGTPGVSLSWDQWRADTGDNVWFSEDISYTGWFGIELDQDASLHPQGLDPVTGGLGVFPLTPGAWQNIRLDLDFQARTIEAFLNGASQGRFLLTKTEHFRGFDVEEEATPFMGDNGPFYMDNLRISALGPATIPEPGTLGLLAVGLLPLRRRKR